MTPFSAAAVAALERPNEGLKPGVYSYVTELELTVKKNGQFAPGIVAQILAKLVLDDPDIVFVDGSQQHILVANFPTSKAEFNEVFCTSTSGGWLSCKFETQSYRNSFHDIKVGAWDLLQKHQVWFKQAPGPLKKTTLVAVGFKMNVHPAFASPSVFLTELNQDVEEQYVHHPEVIAKFRLPSEYTKVDIYLRRRKIHAQYTVDGEFQSIDTDALMTYVPKDTAELAIIHLTCISSLRNAKDADDPRYTPLAAKYHTPEKFGQCEVMHNAFLNNHRNIAIVGLIPDAMDSTPLSGTHTLWSMIRSLPGVFRCDPCRRTIDLGKWNISCAPKHHPDLCKWIDENLVELWNFIPGKDTFPKMIPFPVPERLSKGCIASSGSSVASGLTDASPVEDYF
jgi:hypothetical protein